MNTLIFLIPIALFLGALGWIAAGSRSRFTLPLIAVTGSNGKTTVKEMIAAILRAQVGDEAAFSTRGNLNNDIGVPQTLLALQLQTLVGDVACLLLCLEHVERVAGCRRAVQAEDDCRFSRTCRLYALVALVEHSLDASP